MQSLVRPTDPCTRGGALLQIPKVDLRLGELWVEQKPQTLIVKDQLQSRTPMSVSSRIEQEKDWQQNYSYIVIIPIEWDIATIPEST